MVKSDLIHKRNTNALREYKKAITLNQIQKEVIVGTPFGLPAGDPRAQAPLVSIGLRRATPALSGDPRL